MRVVNCSYFKTDEEHSTREKCQWHILCVGGDDIDDDSDVDGGGNGNSNGDYYCRCKVLLLLKRL